MSVSIKVCVRCRPFTIDDKLGVSLMQTGEESGEIQLLNSSYSTNRFAFSWAWWSAYGYQRHVLEAPPEADQMELIDQQKAYDSVGSRIKDDLLQGNAIVLFAYGLSGSGKTFTVFGPDAPDIPEAWFKHPTPHPLWGIFPRLAYEIFQMKEDGWKVTMKYFQNVVDTVRDLMSPVAQEQSYKSGMKKDQDGFMDIQWCRSVVLKDWDDLRKHFMDANSRKAIAPTQFNHQSTRGHCIMTLEVEMPHPEREGMKQRGRVYVCDLAGTEPAGDIVYANYQKVVFEDGDIEHKYLGPHPDASKSKELQDQGKKINLSLTEMAQFFMKMAEGVKKKTLKPGASIPGCNSYFLCKYLKDTMLQARTYLFCAIRPEVKYHSYTFSTLGFAKNASVIKLQPKKASCAASPAERKLMAELEQMKLLVQQLKEENAKIAASGGGGAAGPSPDMTRMEEMLAKKQRELEAVLTGEQSSQDAEQDKMMQQQREDYARRGISLTYFESDTEEPHFINLDVDSYRSKRFMYILHSSPITFGPGGNIQPLSLNVLPNHCQVVKEGESWVLIGGKGQLFHNGQRVAEGERKELKVHDRVVIGNELHLFIDPQKLASLKNRLEDLEKEAEKAAEKPEEDPAEAEKREEELKRLREETQEPMDAEDAVREYQNVLQGGDDPTMRALKEQMEKFEAEKAAFEKQKGAALEEEEQQRITEEEQQRLARQINDQELRDVLPKMQELSQIVAMLNRGMLTFETSLQRSGGKSNIPKVKIKVHNSETNETIFLDVFEFVKAFSILKDELSYLKSAVSNGHDYCVREENDPIRLLFDNSFQLGTATSFLEMLAYNLDTEEDDKYVDIKLAIPPFNNVGKLEVSWTPLRGVDDEQGAEPPDMCEPEELLGKPWTYRLSIKGATALPVITDLAYCQYEWMGETFTTESVEQNSRNPVFDYSYVHHVDKVDEAFLRYLKTTKLEVHVYINPYIIDPPKDKIATSNSEIVSLLKGETPLRTGRKPGNIDIQRSLRGNDGILSALQEENIKLKKENECLRKNLERATSLLKDHKIEFSLTEATATKVETSEDTSDLEAKTDEETRMAEVTPLPERPMSAARQKLEEAREKDSIINDAGSETT